MRIEVTGAFSTQTRAYAEYRVFSSLARFSDVISEVAVSLSMPPGDTSVTVCAVVIAMAPGARARVSARGRHAYDAINRAAERACDVLRRHGQLALSS